MRWLATALLTALVAAPAAAADDTLRTTTPGGAPVELRVRDTASGTCLTVKVGSEGAQPAARCLAPPADADADVRSVGVIYRGRPEKITVVHGLLSARTELLQLRFGDNRLVEVRPQGPERAYLAVFSGRPPLASARAVGAAGEDLAAADLDPRALRVEPRRGPFRLARTRDERNGRARFEAFTTPLLQPGSLRRRRATCVAVTPRSKVPRSNVVPGYAGGTACAWEANRIVVRFAAGCTGRRSLLLFGLGPSVVRRYVLVTAAGQRIRASVHRLPKALGRPRQRAYLISAADPGPLRRLETYARNGQRVASLPLGSVGSGCAASSRS